MNNTYTQTHTHTHTDTHTHNIYMYVKAYGGCGCHFCAFCLTLCSRADAHTHVASCRDNPHRGQRDAVFCKGEEFERRNKERMQVRAGVRLRVRVMAKGFVGLRGL